MEARSDREGRRVHERTTAVIRFPPSRCGIRTRIQELFTIILGLPLCLAVPAHGQAPQLPGEEGTNLLEWMGHEPGDVLAYDMGGIFSCPRVGDPITIDGRRYAPIEEFEWQGPLRVLIPLDGSVSLAPPPAETAEFVFDSLFFSTSLKLSHSLDFALNAFTDRDGWVAVVEQPDSPPRYLLYRWCTECDDAGTTVLLERGKGILWMTWDSYMGRGRIIGTDESACSRGGPRGKEPGGRTNR